MVVGSDRLVLGAVGGRCGTWELLVEKGDKVPVRVEQLRSAGKERQNGVLWELSRALQTHCEGSAGVAEGMGRS